MTHKKVKYTGGKISTRSSFESRLLEFGKTYEVIDTVQTNYILKGVEGKFDSLCFEDEGLPTYLAVSGRVPIEGKSLKNFIRLQTPRGWKRCTSDSIITEVRWIGGDVYEVHTSDTIYIVQVI